MTDEFDGTLETDFNPEIVRYFEFEIRSSCASDTVTKVSTHSFMPTNDITVIHIQER